MNDKKVTLNEEDFSFLCPLETEDMTIVEGGYFCNECNKKVHDVSDMTINEYEKVVKKTNDICISFKKIAIASLALSVAACASPEKSKHIILKGKRVVKPNHIINKPKEQNNILISSEKVDSNKTADVNKTN